MKYSKEIASEYNSRFDTEHSRIDAIRAVVSQYRNAKVLEVGCGTGHWLSLLRDIAEERVGIDTSQPMLTQAIATVDGVKFYNCNAERMEIFTDSYFDVVFCVDVIHHVEDKAAYAGEVFRILKPGGTFVVIGQTPHEGTTSWFIYDYFDTILETDLKRYISN